MYNKSITHYILVIHAGKTSNLLDYDHTFNLILKLITNIIDIQDN